MSARTVIGEAIITGQSPDGKFTPFAATQPVQASGVLTSDNTNVSDGDTVTIGSTTYTFKTALAGAFTAGQVLIGGSADASLTNLAAAINGSGGGVYWMTGPNAQVSSSAVAAHALTITARVTDGTSAALGNSISTSKTSSHLSWGATTLAGGSAGSLIVGGGSGGSGIPITPASVSPTFVSATASSTTIIPIGSIGSGVLILTGTGTLNSVAWPTGTPWNEPNKLAASVTLVLASASTAVVYYGT